MDKIEENKEGSEKIFLIKFAIFRGIVLFLRKVVLPEKAKSKDTEEEKKEDQEQISDEIIY